jgi:adenosine deaminase
MINYPEYLRRLPKTELHCHFIATIRATTLVELARKHDVALPTYDTDALFDYDNIVDFLAVFEAAMPVLRSREDFIRIAYESVEDGLASNIRYREYFINATDFDLGYAEVMDAVIEGLTAAEQDFGVGFGIIAAIDRSRPVSESVELVKLMLANPREQVVGLGQDDLTPANTESPELWHEAYALAAQHGINRTAHVGEIHGSTAENVLVAIRDLDCSRIDHGYHVMDDPEVVKVTRDLQIPFTCTPISTNVLSGWPLTPEHHIARMIRAGLNVTLSTDDPTFFRTSLGREYAEGMPAMGFGPDVARAVTLAGLEASWCDEARKQRLRVEFADQLADLDAQLDLSTVPAESAS